MELSSRIVVDSSVLIALYLKGDFQHQKANLIFSETINSTLIIHPFVIQETATVLAYKGGIILAQKFLRDICNAQNIHIPETNINEEIKNYLNVTRRVSFTDMSIILLASREKAQLLSFDKQMVSVAKTFDNKGVK